MLYLHSDVALMAAQAVSALRILARAIDNVYWHRLGVTPGAFVSAVHWTLQGLLEAARLDGGAVHAHFSTFVNLQLCRTNKLHRF